MKYRSESTGPPTPPTGAFGLGDWRPEVRYLRLYLEKFGYLAPCDCDRDLFCNDLKVAISKYQMFFGLPVTGMLDPQTRRMMRQPRCGNPDITPDEDIAARVHDYKLSGGKWDHTDLTYFFQNGTGDIGGTTEWDLCREAMDKWAAITSLTFDPASSEAAAEIRFLWASGDHGDGSPFDGSGNTYAHGFYPPPVNPGALAGDVHFDESEDWNTHDEHFLWWQDEIDQLTVAIHEVGHALGLEHSSTESAVMWPHYEGERRNLTPDDIAGIQALYGPPVVVASSRFVTAGMWALKSTGGYGSVLIDLGRPQRFLAYASVTMIDSLSEFDEDNAVVAEVFQVDGAETFRAVYGGDHWGPAGSSDNVHQGAYVGTGRQIAFRIRAAHREDLDAFGTATVIKLDEPWGLPYDWSRI
jgi:hypothetical protein